MKTHYGVNYNVMENFLRSKVGEPWDDVYSHIRKAFPDAFNRRRHGYSRGFYPTVETSTWMGVDGKVYCDSARGVFEVGKTCGSRQFYVHPWTRVLCENRPTSWRAEERNKRAAGFVRDINYKWVKGPLEVTLGPKKKLAKIEKIWYYLETVTHEETRFEVDRAADGSRVCRIVEVQSEIKQQLSWKELRSHGLRNG